MFRKLVSNLSFSPALITQVGFYARRLKQEEVTRRLTIVFVVLTLVVQSLVMLSPPESANASSEQDLIRGGVESLEDFLVRYDKNTDDIKDIYTTLGIERSEIAAASASTFNSKSNLYSLSRFSQYSPQLGETSFVYVRSAVGTATRYISPLRLADTSSAKKSSGTTYQGWIGHSAKVGWFAVSKANASPVTKGFPATITPSSSTATSSVVKSISVKNSTRNDSAISSKVASYDKLIYTISLQNTGTSAAQVPVTINLSDALEYSTLVDGGGGTFDNDSKNLSWGAATILPGSTQERVFALSIVGDIPAYATGQSNANSYDCIMSSSFGTTIQVPVDCPATKTIEGIFATLPHTDSWGNIAFSVVLLSTVLFFYLRTKQLKKEIRLVRHNVNTGVL